MSNHHFLYGYLQANPNYNPQAILVWIQKQVSLDDYMMTGFRILEYIHDDATIKHCCKCFLDKYKTKYG